MRCVYGAIMRTRIETAIAFYALQLDKKKTDIAYALEWREQKVTRDSTLLYFKGFPYIRFTAAGNKMMRARPILYTIYNYFDINFYIYL